MNSRREAKEIVNKIANNLPSTPNEALPIQTVSLKSGVNWDTTKRYLETLANLGVVNEITLEGRKHYYKSGRQEDDTLFSIPMKDDHKRIVRDIYGTIESQMKKTGHVLPKTLVQKIAVDVVEEKYPQIPRFWYMYGKLLLLPYKQDEKYEPSADEDMIEVIKRRCEEYSKYRKSSDIRLYQYLTQDNDLYITKEVLLHLFTNYNKSEMEKDKIREAINKFSNSAQKHKLTSMASVIVEDFATTILVMFRNLSDRELVDAKPTINQTFQQIWNLVAINQAYNSLVEFYNNSKFVEDYLIGKMMLSEENAMNALDTLQELEPPVEIPDDEIGKKIKSLQGSARELTPAEKKKAKEMTEKMSQEELMKLFGL